MMHPGFIGFGWPVFLIAPVLFIFVAFIASRVGFGPPRPMGFGCAASMHYKDTHAEHPVPDSLDPLATLKESYVRGDIELSDFERRLDELMRKRPAELN